MRHAAAVLAVAALLAAAPAPARADDEREREARALFREGNRLVKEGDYAGALQMFHSAYARLPNPKILINIGTTLQLLGRSPEAGDTYQRYLADPDADPKRRDEVEAALRKIDASIGKLRITVDEPGARVVVDGTTVGESPQTILLRVKVGTHTVVAEKQGIAPAVATIQVAAGEERSVDLRLVTTIRETPPADTEMITGEPAPGPEPAGTTAVLDPRATVRAVAQTVIAIALIDALFIVIYLMA